MNLELALSELNLVKDKLQLEEFFQKYLGKKWLLNEEFAKMKDATPEEKKTLGWKLSEIKTKLTEEYSKKESEISIGEINAQLEKDIVDISVTGKKYKWWHFSLLAKTRKDMEKIAESMWFTVDYGHEVVTKYENFASVNIPLTHPATEMHDTMYINEKDMTGENLILRTHNSSQQVRDMLKMWAPMKLVCPGRDYRFDDMDAHHDVMFHQLEWIYIDKNVSIANFKECMLTLLSAVLGREVELRFRPCYFPFVEPGFEIDARYDIVDAKTGKTEKSDRMEILWAWMMHPNVLREWWIDPEVYTGFAFGIGISRLAAVRYGIKDIRYFTNWDLRFVKSF